MRGALLAYKRNTDSQNKSYKDGPMRSNALASGSKPVDKKNLGCGNDVFLLWLY